MKLGVMLSFYDFGLEDIPCGYIFFYDKNGNVQRKGDAYVLENNNLFCIDEEIEGHEFLDIDEWFDTEKEAKNKIFDYLKWCQNN